MALRLAGEEIPAGLQADPGKGQMIVERMFPSGGYLIYSTVDGYLRQRRYYGYTKREAIRLFKQEMKEIRQ